MGAIFICAMPLKLLHLPANNHGLHPSTMHIAFFDSGLGGLSIAREVFEHPQAHQLAISQCSYIADTAAFPYGDKDDKWLKNRIEQVIASSLQVIQPDIVVVACNTASTLALDALRDQFTIPFVGVVPAIKPAAQHSRSNVMGILATPATVARDYTAQLILNYADQQTVHLYGAAALVAQAENKLLGAAIDQSAISQVLQALLSQDKTNTLDTVVLACTHFPLLREELAAAATCPLHWVDSGEAIARRVIQICGNPKAESLAPSKFSLQLLTTGGILAKRYQNLTFALTPQQQGPYTFSNHIALMLS